MSEALSCFNSWNNTTSILSQEITYPSSWKWKDEFIGNQCSFVVILITNENNFGLLPDLSRETWVTAHGNRWQLSAGNRGQQVNTHTHTVLLARDAQSADAERWLPRWQSEPGEFLWPSLYSSLNDSRGAAQTPHKNVTISQLLISPDPHPMLHVLLIRSVGTATLYARSLLSVVQNFVVDVLLWPEG